MSLEKKLDFWIKNNYNVLFRGKPGCGKTAMITEAFTNAGLKWKYFSTSTMDPWVDFIGVPKEIKDENGNSHLELIRPKAFRDDEVEALFFDEFNRGSSKKIKNAVMELIQFKSINGKKFNKLKIVWAAINPIEENVSYDVDELDPAQLDRFQIVVDVPYKPSISYFRTKYGNELAEVAVNWWNELPDAIKNITSPRRLDYALDVYTKKGDLHDVFDSKVNVNKLLVEIESGSITKHMHKLFEENNTAEAKKFLVIENNFSACKDKILQKDNYIKFFVPLISDEKKVALMAKNSKVFDLVANEGISPDATDEQIKLVQGILSSIKKSNTGDYKLVNKCDGILRKIEDNQKHKALMPKLQDKCFYNETALTSDFSIILNKTNKFVTGKHLSTQDRSSNYTKMMQYIPQIIQAADQQKTLDILTNIIEHSQHAKLNEYKYLVPMINHLVKMNPKLHMNSQTLAYLEAHPMFINYRNPTPKFGEVPF